MMAPSGLLRVYLLYLTVGLPAVEAVLVIVGDQFIFPFTCNRGQSGSLKLNLGEDELRAVADFTSGEWKPVGEYRDRIRENSSRIIFTRTRYTDGRGIYEMTCGETEPQLLQLQVVFALDVSVTQSEAALLPCYFNNKPGSFSWIKDGTVLCELKSGSVVCRGTADRRLSVSKDWSHGNLSLILDRAQPEDQGVYYCFIQDGPSNNQSGSPAAVRLRVRDKTRATPSPEQQTQMKTWIIIVITAIVTLLVVACCFLLGWCLHTLWSKVPSKTRAGGPSSQMEMKALCSSPNSQVNGGPKHG